MSWQKLELLAPAGNLKVLENVVEAGADAVYLGGKRFNMRLLRPEFNFSDQELAQAVTYLHELNKKLYITVNNLYKQPEINEIKEYLLFLQDIKVDALIIQDLGLIKLCQEMAIDIPVHASVQMGVNNLEAVSLLEANGISRVILSKNLNLEEIQAIHNGTEVGIEYFVHGDLCVSHTGQCFLSSFIFGESGNRGRCRKPCRWSYKLSGVPDIDPLDEQHYLAHKDLCLYPHLADIIEAGVSSFKIEGRMRSGEQLAFIVGAYRQALDIYLTNPEAYTGSAGGYQELEEKRVRDYTSGSLYRSSNQEDIGLSGEREPLFPTAPIVLNRLNKADWSAARSVQLHDKRPELTVKVGDMQGFSNMLAMGVDNIILGLDGMRQQAANWNIKTIQPAIEKSRQYRSRIFIETPRIVSQKDLPDVQVLMEQSWLNQVDGFLVNDLGSLKILQSRQGLLWTGYGLNVSNSKASAFLKKLGVERVSAGLEMNAQDLQQLLQADTAMELLVQGPLPGIITDLCLFRSKDSLGQECSSDCLNSSVSLLDQKGQSYNLYSDYKCRNYLYHPYERSLYPYLAQLMSWGLESFRIDGQYYSPNLLNQVVSQYQKAINDIQAGRWEGEERFTELLDLFPQGLTAMPLLGAEL